MQNNESDELEELDRSIDSALHSYVDAQPSPDLAYRVIENIHRDAHRKSRLWWWAIATPVLAASLLVILYESANRHTSPPQPTVVQQSIAPTEPVDVPPLHTASPEPTVSVPSFAHRRTHPESAGGMGSTQPAHIPVAAPTPAAVSSDLTLNDSALVAFARENPEQLQALFAKTDAPDPEPIVPIRIDDIEIKPIAIEDLP